LWADIGVALALLVALIVVSRIVSFRMPEGGLPRNFETWMWLFMRWSGVLLVPLVWIHVLLNDIIVGVHGISLDYVALRWATIGWRIYDVALLSFTFAHGMNGLRNVLSDYVRSPGWRAFLPRLLLIGWVAITAVGAVAIVGGVR
jgi:succinate dehydrogenase / fumarate reductase membrane anchor subunit